MTTPMGTGSSNQQITILELSKMEALLWLRDFLEFFQKDYLQWQSEEELFIQQQ